MSQQPTNKTEVEAFDINQKIDDDYTSQTSQQLTSNYSPQIQHQEEENKNTPTKYSNKSQLKASQRPSQHENRYNMDTAESKQNKPQLYLKASERDLTQLIAPTANAKLTLPDGKTYTVVKYVPPKDMTPGKDNTGLNSNSLKSVEPSTNHILDKQDTKQRKPKFTLKRPVSEVSKQKTDSKWLKKEDLERKREYKFSYLTNFNERKDDKKWEAATKAKIFGDKVPSDEDDKADGLEVFYTT